MSTITIPKSLLEPSAEPTEQATQLRDQVQETVAVKRTGIRPGFFRSIGWDPFDFIVFAVVYLLSLLLVAGCYFATRWAHVEAWRWGTQLMNLPLGVIGVATLLLASSAALFATWAATCEKRPLVIASAAVAAIACLGFVTTLVVDQDVKNSYGIRPGANYHPNERYAARRFGVKLPKKPPVLAATNASETIPVRHLDAAQGRRFFLGTCATCHGPQGAGLPNLGKKLIANEFVGQQDDAKLLAFLKVGRQPWDPLNTTKVQMPPRGGNPMLSDDDLRDVVAYVRTLQSSALTGDGRQETALLEPAEQAKFDLETLLLTNRCVVSPPAIGPRGLSPLAAEFARPAWKPPRDGVEFVNSYYMLTSFVELLAGLVALALAALVIMALRRSGVADLQGPLTVTTSTCISVALFWVFLFPFVYLF